MYLMFKMFINIKLNYASKLYTRIKYTTVENLMHHRPSFGLLKFNVDDSTARMSEKISKTTILRKL